MNRGYAECGIDIWGRLGIAYRYEGLGIRAFYPVDSSIPESERNIIEKFFTQIDRDYFYEFVRTCYERHRAIEITPIEPLTVSVTPSVVEVFNPVWIEIKGTRGSADIEIYVDDQLIERYENQSVPQRGQYIPRFVGAYKIVVKHRATGEVAGASFVATYKPPPPEVKPQPLPLPEAQPPTPTPAPPTTQTPTPPGVVERPRSNIALLALFGYIVYEVFKRR